MARFGSNTLFIKDVVLAADWKQVLDTTLDKFDSLDIVVNNAGTTYRNKPTLRLPKLILIKCLMSMSRESFFQVNTIVPYFIERGKGGTFIQISSTAALRPRPGLTWYNATKGAVSRIPNLLLLSTANTISGLIVFAPLLVNPLPCWQLYGRRYAGAPHTSWKAFHLVAFQKPEDIANSVAFLASDDAAFLTGLDLR